MEPQPNPWDQRTTETPESFEGFDIYRLLGPARKLKTVWEQLGKSHTLIERWSSRHDWPRRAALWDADRDAYRRQELKAGELPMRERYVNIAAAVSARLSRRIAVMTEEEIAKISPSQIASLLHVALDVEKQAREDDDKLLALPLPNRKRIRYHTDEEISRVLHATRGLKAIAARRLGLTHRGLNWRVQHSKYLQEIVKEIDELNLDYDEEALFQKVGQRDLGAICFRLKTKGRSRGFIERIDFNAIPSAPPPQLIVNFTSERNPNAPKNPGSNGHEPIVTDIGERAALALGPGPDTAA